MLKDVDHLTFLKLIVIVVLARLSEIIYSIGKPKADDSRGNIVSELQYLVLSGCCFTVTSICWWKLDLLPRLRKFTIPLPFLYFSCIVVSEYYISKHEKQISISSQFLVLIYGFFTLCVLSFSWFALHYTKHTILAVLLVLLGIYLLGQYSMSHVTYQLRDGIGGMQMDDNPYCRVADISLWRSALPNRAFNFFTGPATCSGVVQFSKVIDNKLWFDTEKCQQPIRTVINSEFNNMPNHPDLDRLRHTMAKEVEIFGITPVELNSQVKSIRSFCGDIENYHVVNIVDQTLLQKARRTSTTPPDVLMIMIDAISRPHFLRKLPQTISFLEQLNQKGFNQFFRYSTIGFSTSGNLPPMLTGDEFGSEKAYPAWQDFKQKHSFVTTFIVDQCEDYYKMYGNSKNLDFEVTAPEFCHPDYDNQGHWGNFAGPYALTRRCIAGHPLYNYTFGYLEQVLKNYHDAGKFTFASFLEAHEGSMEVIGSLDGRQQSFLKEAQQHGHLDKAITFMVSDHGNHMGPYFEFSTSGREERKMPVLFIIVPDWFLDRHPNIHRQLKTNEQYLVTAYDIYATIGHLAHLPDPPPVGLRGTSLFQQISSQRTCKQAHVPDLNCICQK